MGNAGAEALGELLAVTTSLTELNLSANTISDKGYATPRAASRQSDPVAHGSTSVSGGRFAALCAGLAVNRSLVTLRCDEGKGSVTTSEPCLLVCCSSCDGRWTRGGLGAHIHYDNVGDAGAMALGQALKTNTTLRTLSLVGQFIKVGDMCVRTCVCRDADGVFG